MIEFRTCRTQRKDSAHALLELPEGDYTIAVLVELVELLLELCEDVIVLLARQDVQRHLLQPVLRTSRGDIPIILDVKSVSCSIYDRTYCHTISCIMSYTYTYQVKYCIISCIYI